MNTTTGISGRWNSEHPGPEDRVPGRVEREGIDKRGKGRLGEGRESRRGREREKER